MPELREQFKPAAVETIKDNQSLTFWYYKPDIQGIETLTLTQYEDWPLQIEAKIQCADMENEPETTPAPDPAQTAPAASEPKAEAKAEPAPAPVPTPKHDAAPVAKPAPKAVSAQNMPAIMEGSSHALIKVVLVIVLMIVVVYVALVYFSNGGDWNLLNMLK